MVGSTGFYIMYYMRSSGTHQWLHAQESGISSGTEKPLGLKIDLKVNFLQLLTEIVVFSL